jgi:hypothetical protein
LCEVGVARSTRLTYSKRLRRRAFGHRDIPLAAVGKVPPMRKIFTGVNVVGTPSRTSPPPSVVVVVKNGLV